MKLTFDHQVIKNLVNISVPLLRAGADCDKVTLSPLPRYLKKCCGNKTHLVNRREPGFKTMLEDGLEEVRKSLKDLIHGKKIHNFTVMSPLELFPNDDSDDEQEKIVFWGTDPVHLTVEGYDELVRALAEAAVSGSYERSTASDTKEKKTTAAQPKKRPPVHKRQSWVSEDDTTAQRVYNHPRGGGIQFKSGRGHYCGQRPFRGRRGLKFVRGRGRGGGQRSWPY
jgi:hypothetical protein